MALNFPWLSEGQEPIIGSVFDASAGTPTAVAANTTAEQSIVVPAITVPAGYALARTVGYVNKPTAQAGLGIAGVRVIDGTHIGITYINATAAAITPTASEIYKFFVLFY